MERELPALSSLIWKDFKISNLFKIRDGYYNKKPPQEKNGNIPFLGATSMNNGITAFYSEHTINYWDKVGCNSTNRYEKRYFEGNCLTVVNNGSVGYVYYQDHMFTCSHDMTPIYLKHYKLNKQIGMFLVRCMNKTGEMFSYARKWRPKRIRTSKIYLPINDKLEPDYKYMERYILVQQIKEYYKILNHFHKLLDSDQKAC